MAVSNGQVNGTPAAKPPAPPPEHVKAAEPVGDVQQDDPLGPWEASISNTTPVSDMTKTIADFLFLEVVNRNDWGELQSRGVQVEVEAKLGQLIDKETQQRYWLPVATECVLGPSNRVAFKSSMTEVRAADLPLGSNTDFQQDQHRMMNNFLNEMVTQAHPSNVNRPKPRVPIQYAHRRERDSFYDLPPQSVQALPPSIQQLLKQAKRHSVRMRASHDQKSGELLARIIKTRVRDLDIYIPNSPLDCRISVNLEMKYDGDVGLAGDPKSQPDRLKDRLSYSQSNYQIDLTQVSSIVSRISPHAI